MVEQKPKGPLDGILVVEFAAWHAGPAAGAMLCDLGAEVIKVEVAGRGDPMRGINMASGLNTMLDDRNLIVEDLNRGKKGIALDPKHPKGRQILLALVGKADVFLTNYLPGKLRDLGLDYETLRAINPRIVYASASAYGKKGRESEVSALEPVMEAKAGMRMSCGEPNSPPVTMVPGLGDRTAAIFLAYSVLATLLTRERFGISQEAWTSGLGGLIALQSPLAAVMLGTGQQWQRTSVGHMPNPLYSQFECQDGRWIVFGALPEDAFWKPFCQVLGDPELVDDPRFVTGELRFQHAAELRPIVERLLASRPAREWEADFVKAKVRCTVAQTLYETLSDPQVLANEYVVDYDHPALGRKLKMLGYPVQLSETPARIRGGAPNLGQHTEEVLTEMLGYSWADIEDLSREGVI